MKENIHYILVKKDGRGLYTVIVDDESHGEFKTQKSAWKKAISIMHYNLKKERKAIRKRGNCHDDLPNRKLQDGAE